MAGRPAAEREDRLVPHSSNISSRTGGATSCGDYLLRRCGRFAVCSSWPCSLLINGHRPELLLPLLILMVVVFQRTDMPWDVPSSTPLQMVTSWISRGKLNVVGALVKVSDRFLLNRRRFSLMPLRLSMCEDKELSKNNGTYRRTKTY